MEPNDSNDERQPRNIRNQPFAWQDKKTLTMIAEIFDATNDVNSARSVYVALTEFASDNGCETFTVPINQIARRSGVSYRTASGILNRFESLRLIAVQRHIVERTKERANLVARLNVSCLVSRVTLLSTALSTCEDF